MPDQKRKEFKKLVDKYLNGTATPEEHEALDRYYRLFGDRPEYTDLLTEDQLAGLEKRMENNLFERINRPVKVKRLWPHVAAASSIILVLSFGGYFLLHKKQPNQMVQAQRQDVAPGRNQATLTLANGRKIILTKGLTGKLAQQGHTVINANVQAITYTTLSVTTNDATIQYNTLTTVRGEQSPAPLQLADGTKVWLNAASSITFPTTFQGTDRTVKITGEAYFDVKHDVAHPFKVMVRGQTIEDLGTVFNVNAYDDEPNILATLLSGKIRLTNPTGAATLHPGQVAIVGIGKPGIMVKDVDTEGAIAWMKGYFLFDHENLESVMRKVSRWYDVDVEYPDGKVMESYIGSASRYTNVSEVLKVLQLAGDVRFKVEGKKIIVLKK